jgi:hypothetical protein
MTSIRQVTPGAWVKTEGLVPKVNVRNVTPIAFASKRAVPTKASAAALLDLINSHLLSGSFTADQLSFATPVTDTSVDGLNTTVQVTATGTAPVSGSVTLRYARIAISRLFTVKSFELTPPASNTTISALLTQINAAYGTSFLAGDLVDGPVLAGATSITLQPAANNYILDSNSTVTLSGTQPVKALLHFSGMNNQTTFVDDVGRQWQRQGSPVLSSAQINKNPTSLYVGASGGQYVYTAVSPDFQCTGDFTVEGWFYMTTTSALSMLCAKADPNWAVAPTSYFAIKTRQAYIKTDSGAETAIGSSTSVPPAGQWFHLAFQRSGSTFTMFTNGVSQGTVNIGGTWGGAPYQFSVGGAGLVSSSWQFPGYISEFRFTKGVARYPSTGFTAPPMPLWLDGQYKDIATVLPNTSNADAFLLATTSATSMKAVANRIASTFGINLLAEDVVDTAIPANPTSITITVASTSRIYTAGSTVTLGMSLSTQAAARWLTSFADAAGNGPTRVTKALMHFDNNVTDQVTGHTWTLNGGGTTFVGTNKFGGYSLYLLGGTAYYASAASSDDFIFNGDFTFEWWQYQLALPGTFRVLHRGAVGADSTSNCSVSYSSQSVYFKLDAAASAALIASNVGFVANTWQHIVVQRSGSTMYFFVNGVLKGQSSGFTGSWGNFATALLLGTGSGSSGYYGYIDEFRMSSVARYPTGGFTPPAAPFTID